MARLKTRKRHLDQLPGAASPGRRRRRLPWPLVAALTVAGVVAVATVLSSRRIRPLHDWDDLLGGDDDLASGRRSRFPSTPVHLPGPAGELHVDDGGAGGLPVVFVHGLGGSAAHWCHQLAHLREEGRRTLAVDLRGHGRSEPPADGDWSVAALAADVVAAADELGLERFVLAGHSLGGVVAIAAAARLGSRVAGLVLVDANGDQTRVPRGELDAFLQALAGDPRGELRTHFKQILLGAVPGVADLVLADLDRTSPEGLVRALESSFATSPVAALAEYPGPRLAIVSDLNSLPFSLHNLLPDLPVHHVPGTSHWLMLDRPEEVDRLLDEFLAAVEGDAGAEG
jgi:pimeloyl-ACP methyl ester carboxylesterase